MQKPKARKRWKRAALGLLGLAVATLFIDYYAYPWGSAVPATHANKDQNGLWIRYTHYFGEVSDAETQGLGDRLAENKIAYAFFHVRFIKKDGTLAYRYPENAQRMLKVTRERAPRTRMIAWVFAGNRRGSGDVDLAQEGVRRSMVREAAWLINDCGFDGVQWDYEMCASGDKDFLRLLEETRAAIPAGKFLSVCAPVIYPGPVNYGWSDDYITNVAERCDQIAVMCYDTALYLPRSYVWLAKKQVERYSRAIAKGDKRTTFLIGVPTYEEGFRSHGQRAETLLNAIRGVKKGYESAKKPSNFDGIAIFADYTTDADEWAEYKRDWLGR